MATKEMILSALSNKEIIRINVRIDEELVHELIVDYCLLLDKQDDGTYVITNNIW